ncbi:MAG: rhodanese-like domain-containing protein [Planctomycetota bacterium]|nr:rhodanese-like domain-containing protein [Planctomycetota bacterium]
MIFANSASRRVLFSLAVFGTALGLVGLGFLNTAAERFAQADDRDLEPKEHTKDSLASVKEKIADKKAVLVDVRDLVEWNAGHVQGAILLPWRDLQDKLTEAQVKEKLPKEKIIYTHCAVGYRSLRAAKILKKYGYEVRALKPGYDELVKAGFTSEKKASLEK